MDPDSVKQNKYDQKSKIPSVEQFTFLNFSFPVPLTQDLSEQKKNEELVEKKKVKFKTNCNKKVIQLNSLKREESQIIRQGKEEENSVGELKANQNELASLSQKQGNMKLQNGIKQNLQTKKDVQEQAFIQQINKNGSQLKRDDQHIFTFSSPLSEKQTKELKLSYPSPDNTMRGEINAVGNWLLSFGKDLKALKSVMIHSDFYMKCKNKAQQSYNQYYQPLKRLYHCLPLALTQIKYELFPEFSFHSRVLFLTSLSVLWGTTRIYSRNYHGLRLLRVTTKSMMTFIIGGIILVPEIYYPFIKLQIQSLTSNEPKCLI